MQTLRAVLQRRTTTVSAMHIVRGIMSATGNEVECASQRARAHGVRLQLAPRVSALDNVRGLIACACSFPRVDAGPSLSHGARGRDVMASAKD